MTSKLVYWFFSGTLISDSVQTVFLSMLTAPALRVASRWKDWRSSQGQSFVQRLRATFLPAEAPPLILEIVLTALIWIALDVGQRAGTKYGPGILALSRADYIFAAVAFGLGIAAYQFKRRALRWYGITEVLIGMLTAFNAGHGLHLHDAMFARWAALIGSIYVVSRGCGNVHDASKPPRTFKVKFASASDNQ